MDWPLIFMFIFAGTSALVDLLGFFGVTPKRFMKTEESQRSTVKISLLLMLLTWGAVAYDLYDRHYMSQDITKNTSVLKRWGTVHRVKGAPWQVQSVVNGKHLMSYESGYRVAVICYRTDGTKHDFDVTNLQKSSLYDIDDADIHIVINVDEAFVEGWKRGERMTNYFPLLVPRGVTMEQFSTLRQAQALGVIRLAGGAGAP